MRFYLDTQTHPVASQYPPQGCLSLVAEEETLVSPGNTLDMVRAEECLQEG